MTVSTLMDGAFGIRDVCLSLPVIVGRGGAEELLPIHLTEAEQAQLRRSADSLRAMLEPQPV